MLARRFTIVCLLVAVFGMGLAVLVAENSRAGHAYALGYVSCNGANHAVCTPAFRRH